MVSCRLKGVNVLVTGASKGIGRAIAVRLGGECGRIAVNYRRDREGAMETARLVRERGGEAEVFQADVGDPASVESLASQVREVFGRVPVVVSNAGVGYAVPFEDLSLELWERQYRVNLRGSYLVTKAFLDDMKREGWGRIVYVSSIAGITGAELLSAYSAFKAGIIGLARALALELARYNVRVNVVAPGFVETRLGVSYFKLLSETRGRDLLAEYLRLRTLTGRLARPEEVAELVVPLVDPSIDSVTGQVFVIDSGTTISSGAIPR